MKSKKYKLSEKLLAILTREKIDTYTIIEFFLFLITFSNHKMKTKRYKIVEHWNVIRQAFTFSIEEQWLFGLAWRPLEFDNQYTKTGEKTSDFKTLTKAEEFAKTLLRRCHKHTGIECGYIHYSKDIQQKYFNGDSRLYSIEIVDSIEFIGGEPEADYV